MDGRTRLRLAGWLAASLGVVACSGTAVRKDVVDLARIDAEEPKQCKLERPTGSNVKREVCRTNREVLNDAETAADMMEESRRRAIMHPL